MVKKQTAKKSEIQEQITNFYKEATANYRTIGSQKVQLISSSVFGMGLLLTFATLIYYLAKDSILVDFGAVWFVVLLFLLILAVFSGIAGYFMFLHKVQRINAITTLLLEKLLKEYLSGEKDEDQVIDEAYKLAPQMRVADGLNAIEKKWFRNSLKTKREKELIDYLTENKG
jgi:hypothetical protein